MSEEQVYSARHWAAKAAASAQAAAQSAQNSRGLAIGQLVWSQSSLAKDNLGCLPLWTGEYYTNASTLYPDFYAWVKSHPELCKTKAEYDELVNTAQGCLFYVVDEVEGSLRLPKYKLGGRVLVDSKQPTATSPSWYNLYSDGWLEQGGYFANPQTIGTGAITETFWKPYAAPPTLLFGNMSTRGEAAYDSEHYPYDVTATGFTHKNIQPNGQGTRWYAVGFAADTPIEKIRYRWICAYNAATPASTAQAAEFQQALTGKANADLSNCPTEYDYVVDSGVLEDGSWWRRYKRGWLEQGNSSPTGDQGFTLNKTINFPKPFADNTYMLVGPGFYISNAGAQTITRTATGFTTSCVQNLTGCAYWYACGQGAED